MLLLGLPTQYPACPPPVLRFDVCRTGSSSTTTCLGGFGVTTEGGRGLGQRALAVSDEREHLVQADRHIAECKNHMARHRQIIQKWSEAATTPLGPGRCWTPSRGLRL